MELSAYESMYATEDGHWWYRGMERITISLLNQLYPSPRNLRILDAGCGTGGATRFLLPFGTVTGCDVCGYPGDPGRTQATDGHFVTVTFTSLCGNGTIDASVSREDFQQVARLLQK